jgi:GntR family transcriptional regulator
MVIESEGRPRSTILMPAPEPAFRRIAGDLRQRILSGALPVGAKLPSYRDLMLMYGVSETVIRNAMLVLHGEELIETRHGSGTYVRDRSES